MRNLVINVDVWSMMFAEILVGFHFVLNKLTFWDVTIDLIYLESLYGKTG